MSVVPEIPTLLSAKAAAADYMNGAGAQRARYPAGIRRMIELAEGPEATAAGNVIKELAKLAELERSGDEHTGPRRFGLSPVDADEAGNIIRLKSA